MRGPRLRSAHASLRPRRSGLTLLEVLLSAGLGIILIGGIYAAIEQSWRMSASGKVELERQQVARAVLRQLTLDIRSAAFTAKPSGETGGTSSSSNNGSTGGSSNGGTGSGSGSGSGGGSGNGTGGGTGTGSGSSGSSQSSTVAGEDKPQWTTSEGIRGTTAELMIDISHPRYLSSLMAVNGQMPSDLQTVIYAVGSASALMGSSSTPSTTTSRPDHDGIGLFRSVADRYGLQPVGGTSTGTSGSTLGGQTKQLAPEVAGLQFRYFDGLAWKTEWDSITLGMLPRAIEVTILFEPPPSQGVMTNTAVSIGTDKYRSVIPVPTSDPVLTEEAY